MNIKKLSKLTDSIRRVNDGAEQRARHNAVKLILSASTLSEEEAKQFVDSLRHRIPALSGSAYPFIEGIVRWYVEGQVDLSTDEGCSKVDSFLRAFRSSPLSIEYSRNFELDGRRADFKTLCEICGLDIESTFEGIDDLKGHEYKVVKIESFEDLSKYARYTKLWCISNGEDAFNSYTINGVNKMFLCLRDDYKTVPAKPGKYHPRDAYGASIICVILNTEGQIVTVTSRWNSDGEQDRFLSDMELEELIGEDNMDILMCS